MGCSNGIGWISSTQVALGSIVLCVEEVRRTFEISQSDRAVDAWVSVRPPFEPQGWQLEFRNALRHAVRSIGSAGGRAIRFSWSLVAPPPAPTGERYPHLLRYRASADDVEPLGTPVATICAEVDTLAPELKPLDVWLALKRGRLDVHRQGPLDAFALRATVAMPRPRSAATLVKPVFDGAIAALQHDPDPATSEIGARLLAERCRADGAWLANAIRAPGPLGAVTPLVRQSPRGGLVWNPRDDDCLLGEIRVVPGSTVTIRVEAFALADPVA